VTDGPQQLTDHGKQVTDGPQQVTDGPQQATDHGKGKGWTVADGQVARVTVVAPTGRADLAVPRRIPAAVLLPLLLDELRIKASADDAAWELARLDGRPVDGEASLADADVHDGDLLLVRRVDTAEPVRYDDVCEIIADAGAPTPWTPACTAIACYAAGAALVLVTIVVAVVGLAPSTRLPVCAAVLTVLVLGLAAVHRRAAHGFVSVMVALVSVCAAVVANTLAGGRPDGVGILAGAAALGAFSLVGGVVAGRHASVVYGGSLVSVLGGIAGLGVIMTGRLAEAVAVCGTVAVASFAVAPDLAVRLSGVASLDRDVSAAIPADTARTCVRNADRALLGMLSGAAACVVVAAVVLVCVADPAACGLAGALALLTLIRSRAFRDRSQVAVLAAAGLCALAIVSAGLPSLGGWTLAVPSVAAVACLVTACAIERRWPGYGVQRVIEIVDVALMCAVPPAVLAVGGAYGAVLALWD